MAGGLRNAAESIVRLLYPTRARCMGCGTMAGFEREWLCEDCRRELAERWVGAAEPPEGGLFDGAAFAYRYGGASAGLTRNLKYRGVRRLADVMGRPMVSAFGALSPARVDCAVPVPMHVRRLRQRGFNHATALAERVAFELDIPVREALVRILDTRQQARLSDDERLRNQEGAFALSMDVAGRRVLLVDDVCTTGATANACARTLLEGGAAAVYLLCFALARNPD